MEGKSGFSPLPWPRPCAGTTVCARMCARKQVASSLLRAASSPPLHQDLPCWLATTDSTGQHLDPMSDSTEQRARTPLCSSSCVMTGGGGSLYWISTELEMELQIRVLRPLGSFFGTASLLTAAAAVTGLSLYFLVQFYIWFLKCTASCLTRCPPIQHRCILFL